MTEIRWNGSGKQRLATGEVIIWSGRQDNDHYEGVALLDNKNNANFVLQWESINERYLYVRMNSKYTKLSVVVGYHMRQPKLQKWKKKITSMTVYKLCLPKSLAMIFSF